MAYSGQQVAEINCGQSKARFFAAHTAASMRRPMPLSTAIPPDELVRGRSAVGLGFSSVSPWAREGISASTFGTTTILWLTLTQLLASAIYALAQTKFRDAEITARDAADKARKASAYSAIWLFVSLLIGAFVASLSATFGGR